MNLNVGRLETVFSWCMYGSFTPLFVRSLTRRPLSWSRFVFMVQNLGVIINGTLKYIPARGHVITWSTLSLTLKGPATFPLAVSERRSCMCKILSSKLEDLQSCMSFSLGSSKTFTSMPWVKVFSDGALSLMERNCLIYVKFL